MTRLPSPRLTQFLVDGLVVTAGWGTALVLTNITSVVTRSTTRSGIMALIAIGVTLVVMHRRGLYAGRPTLPRTDEISRVFTSVLAGASAVAVAAAFLDWAVGAWELLLGWGLVFSSRTLVRGMSRTLAIELPGTSRPERVVIVGTGHEARELADLIDDHPESSMQVAGVIGSLPSAERSGLVDRWIGPTERMIELMHTHGATGAIVTATGFRGTSFRSITKELFQSGYDVHLTTGVSRMGEGRFDVRSLCHEPLVVMERTTVHHPHYWAKRVVDLVGAVVLLALAAIPMLITAILIVLEDRGPVFYSAPRAGRRGQFFPMYKFRSMVTNADDLKQDMQDANERTGPLFKLSHDPRITRVGRFIRETSIDELPQLFNVLRGDMSLVGPRPALPEEEAAFDEELRDRFEVRPGITGLWQVEARSNAAFNAYRRLDLHYVENWSLALDLRILLATAEQVLTTVVLLPLRRLNRGAATDGVQARTTSSQPASNGAEPDPIPDPTGAASPPPVLVRSASLATAGTSASTPTNGADQPRPEVARAEVDDVVVDLRRPRPVRPPATTGPSPVVRTSER